MVHPRQVRLRLFLPLRAAMLFLASQIVPQLCAVTVADPCAAGAACRTGVYALQFLLGGLGPAVGLYFGERSLRRRFAVAHAA